MANVNAVSGLYNAFQDLTRSNLVVREMINNSPLPVWLPPHYTGCPSPTQTCSTLLTELWNLDPHEQVERSTYPPSGLICASPQLIVAIQDLNSAKNRFKATIKGIRTSKKKFNFEGKLKEDPEFKEVMYKKGLSRIDLMACYRQIRVLPPNVQAVSWSWALQAASVEKIRVSDLIDRLCSGTYGQDDYMLNSLANMNPNDFIVERKKKSPQLKVNIKIVGNEDSDSDGWFSSACSGVMVIQEHALPNPAGIIWRDEKDSVKRGSRCKSVFEDDPFIRDTKLYLYKPGLMPQG